MHNQEPQSSTVDALVTMNIPNKKNGSIDLIHM